MIKDISLVGILFSPSGKKSLASSGNQNKKNSLFGKLFITMKDQVYTNFESIPRKLGQSKIFSWSVNYFLGW